jgi:hypothetical protein
MVAERKGLQTGHIEPARANASPSRSTAEGARELTPKEKISLVHLGNGLSKPTDNVGQPLHHNRC